jgi:hypothetical protein
LAFLVPVVLILLVNFVAFILILRSLFTAGTKVTSDRKTKGITQARRSIAILVVLGLTWVFGILAIKDAKLVFQYLFCIFNSLQGLLVFIFYCVLSRDTRQKWRALFTKKEKSDMSSRGFTKKMSNIYTASSSLNSSMNNRGSSINDAISLETK